MVNAIVAGIKAYLGAVWDIITGKESISSTIVNGLKSIINPAKSKGKEISESTAAGIKKGEPRVAAETDSVLTNLLDKVSETTNLARVGGEATSLAYAAGIKDEGGAAVSAMQEVGKSVVQAAAQSLDDLQKQFKKKTINTLKKVETPEGGIDYRGKVITNLKEDDYGRDIYHVDVTYITGEGGAESRKDLFQDTIVSDTQKGYEKLAGSYITEEAWNELSDEVKDEIRDSIAGIVTTSDYKIREKAGKYKSTKRYATFLKEEAILGTASEYESGGKTNVVDAVAAISAAIDTQQFEKFDRLPTQTPINITIEGNIYGDVALEERLTRLEKSISDRISRGFS